MSNIYELVVEGRGREVYTITADSVEEAQEFFKNGDVKRADVTEIEDAEIVSITKRA